MRGEPPDRDERIIDAVETEQRYVSDALHDDLCQTLAGLGLRVEVIFRAASQNKSIPVEQLISLKKIVEEAIDQTRALSKNLNPGLPELGGFGLMITLQQLAAERSRHVPCEFKCESPVSIAEGRIAHTLFRFAQECCRFNPKDSQLNTIRINLFQERDRIHLEVRYEGKNLHEETGLQGSELMHARARSVGGELKVRSEPTHASILCTVPIPTPRPLAKSLSTSESDGLIPRP